MVANPLESRILPTAARWFGQCRPALSPLKGVFLLGIHHLGPGDHMLSQKLLVEVGVEMFAGLWPPKSARTAALSAPIASFCPFAVESGPRRHLTAFSH
jgi:hypothetical protein